MAHNRGANPKVPCLQLLAIMYDNIDYCSRLQAQAWRGDSLRDEEMEDGAGSRLYRQALEEAPRLAKQAGDLANTAYMFTCIVIGRNVASTVQEWEMIRVFDSQIETEENDSEEELIFSSQTAMEGASAATAAYPGESAC